MRSRNMPMMSRSRVVAALALAGLVVACPAAPATDLTGRIATRDGKPLARAAVYIYTAAPKVGISPLCPSCYVDCGKFMKTDRQGRFTIPALSDSLKFTVLVTAQGYEPTFAKRVDPQTGPIEITVARRDPKRVDPSRTLRGRVVGPEGRPAIGATVTPVGYQHGDTLRFGGLSGTDPLSVTNDRGEFVIATHAPDLLWFVRVTARDLAPQAFREVPTGGRPLRFKLGRGATVTGRVLRDGRPLPGVAVGLAQADRRAEGFLEAQEIGTDEHGRFTFSNVAPEQTYVLCGKMSSLHEQGAVYPESVHVAGEGMVDAGVLPVHPAHRIRGRVSLSDGQPVPSGTRVMIARSDAYDVLVLQLDPDGRFEAVGVPPESVTVSAAVRGYRVSPRNPGFDPVNASYVRLKTDRDLDDFELLLEPGIREPRGYHPPADPGKR